ncbi:uncharacterized protein LOC141655952 [Silene latifolia]|uniref:uncharacterized protein LOC141655952 n=1 Tax=Silene latifolia TaxID=37657 RepID=UPI003D77E48D
MIEFCVLCNNPKIIWSRLTVTFDNNALQTRGGFRSLSPDHDPHFNINLGSATSPTRLSQKTFQTASDDAKNITECSEIGKIDSNEKLSPSHNTWMLIAAYVTLAQALLAVVIVLLHGVWQLLDEYLHAILWAVLCSIPLRGIQDALVEFWSEPLRQGLTSTFLAVPVAILRAFADTIIDARDVFSWVVYGEKLEETVVRPEKNGFLRLVRRLVSFSLFVFAYEQIGRFGAVTLLGFGFGFMFISNLSPSTISAVSTLRSDSFRLKRRNNRLTLNKIGEIISQWILSRLKTILAIGLIVGMIIGSLSGLVFFSYHIGSEGKDAIVSLKSRIQYNDLTEKVGIKRWISEDEAMELMDWYTTECYETLLQQIDIFADKYNLSELIEIVKQFVITNTSETKYTFRLKNLMEKPVLDKAKCFATQGMILSFRVLASSKLILDIMVSGIAGVMQFFLQLTVFFGVLYYLLTSDFREVTEKVMKALPVKNPVKKRCVEALNNAISGVLLTTVEIAFFQGCFTWLHCRLFSVHFVYMSTMLSFISPLFPIFPAWFPSLPGAVELVLNGKYVLGICFFVTHVVVMDYGASEIAEFVPGYSAYLTGVSIIGGMTLFPSALEGAIMGPLITTVVIALKDLYTEFVLNESKEHNA